MEVLKKGIEANMDGLKNNIYGLKKGLEAKMDGVETNMDGMEVKMEDMEEKMKDNMENMKNYLKADMEGFTKLIQEMIPNGENIVEETCDEKKIYVCYRVNCLGGWFSYIPLRAFRCPRQTVRLAIMFTKMA